MNYILALTLAAFGIGTSEYVIMGLLPDIATDLNVSIPQAGLLVSGYAMGVVIGAPILTIATARIPRKPILQLLVVLFIVGNVLCALAPTYSILMAARIAASLCHGTFFGVASIAAADLASEGHRARAIAYVFMGVTLANMLGVPIGTAIGHAYGWRAAFWFTSGVGVVAIAALRYGLPSKIPLRITSALQEIRVLKRADVVIPMLLSALSSASLFTVFTYIAPILTDIAGISSGGVTYALFMIGIALTLGTILGGRLGDRNLILWLISLMLMLAAVLFVLRFTLPYKFTAITGLFLWSMLGFALCPMLQLLTVNRAKDAPSLASTLNQSAFHLGNASGAWIGGILLSLKGHGVIFQFGLIDLPLAAACITLVAVALTVYLKQMLSKKATL